MAKGIVIEWRLKSQWKWAPLSDRRWTRYERFEGTRQAAWQRVRRLNARGKLEVGRDGDFFEYRLR